MALFRGDIRSQALEMDTSLSVILPGDRPVRDQPRPYRVLYLYHGIKINSTGWPRWTQLETYCKETGLAVVVPAVQRSFYTDMAMGPAYFTYVADELPRLCCELFGISSRREDTFVGGFSMGGYGALKAALRRPERFGGCAALSVVCDPVAFARSPQGGAICRREIPAIWGPEETVPPEDDLFALAQQAAALPQEDRPRIYWAIGKRDFLYQENQRLRQRFDQVGLGYTYEEWDGVHDWAFWGPAVRKAIRFLLG